MPQYTLYGHGRSRAMRVAWMLEELGQEFDWRPVLPRSGEMRRISPLGKVPVLVVDGTPLRDSVAIVQYLADSHGALTAPAGTLERARQDALTQFCVDEIEGALWTAAKNSIIHPVGLRVPAVKAVCRHEFAVALDTLAGLLGAGPWAMGERFSVPDILFGHCAAWAKLAKFELPGGPVGAYFTRLAERPAWGRVLSRLADAA
ncbi:glutathione S-transferase family protein [Paroceanicella profunda]|uniref:Glutathione S-transferase family protein n=1 Tax=Paroceanicella profunda TaxID=2579971 RepID=A0A5B8FR64_9RHOB|nr:glutathione S-transferase family protein [Paroceanicella profunda]QDL90865.1 glutathione S-transferase family protein [Paroceanicella profunda]